MPTNQQKSQQPLISVIVPCYNVKPYLRRCIDSILAQDYTPLEVIMVDDGSTDGTAELCDAIASGNSEVRVVHKANGGQSSARNAGIVAAQGSLLSFVDSDDYLPSVAISTLYRTMESTGADVAEGRMKAFPEGGSCYTGGAKGSVVTFTQQEAINDVFYQRTLQCSACSKLYRASLFKELRFPVGLIYEDLATIYPILRQVSKLAYTPTVTYCYMERHDSTIGAFTSKRTDVLNIMDRLEEQVSCEAPQYVPAVRSRRLGAHFNLLRIVPLGSAGSDEIVARCWRVIRKLRLSCLLDARVRLKNKLGILVSYLGLRPLLFLINRQALNKRL